MNVSSAIVNLDYLEGIGTDAGAVSFWIRREPGMTRPEVLWFAGDGDADGLGPEPEINVFLSETGRVQFFMEAGEKDVLLSSPRTAADGQWHHVVASWSDESVELYVDGRPPVRDTEPRKNFSRRFLEREVRFGKVGWLSVPSESELRYFTGSVDEIAVWRRGLTKDEVALQYAAALGE